MLGVVCTAAGYIPLLSLDCRYRAAAFAVGDLSIPPFAALWGYLCLGETVERGLILGALLVCVALWMIIRAVGGENAGYRTAHDAPPGR